MCLILFAWKSNPRYHLIVAANRDEFIERPSRPASYWAEHPGLLGGKDLKAGGTWLGITTTGRFTAITNYRDLSNIKHDAPSRGKLTLDYLTSATPPRDYLESIAPAGSKFNGFNLLVGDLNELFYYSSRASRSPPAHGRRLRAGCRRPERAGPRGRYRGRPMTSSPGAGIALPRRYSRPSW